MSSNNGINTSNVKTIVAPIDYVIKGNDDVLNIDTSSGGITNLYLTNIRDSGFERISKRYFINDVSNNASVGKINIIAEGGNTINNDVSFTLESDGVGAEVQIADRTRWIACLNSDIGGGLNSVSHDASLFGNGTPLNPLGVNGFYRKVLFVSPEGNDTTAEKGRLSLPYLTLKKARTEAIAGDLIYVFAGQYLIEESLTKNGITYYFQPNAVVTQDECYVLTDTDDPVAKLTTSILGYGQFKILEQGSKFGFARIVSIDAIFRIEFDSIIYSSTETFYGRFGQFYIKGRYIENSFNRVVRGNVNCVWDMEVDIIYNIGMDQKKPTYAPTIFMAGIDSLTGENVQSKFYIGQLTNGASRDYATIILANCSPKHKVIYKGNITVTLGKEKPLLLCSALLVRDGGILEYEGEINSQGSIAKMIGSADGSITISNSKCYCVANDQNFMPLSVNGEKNYLTVKNSFVKTTLTFAIIGVGFDSSLTESNFGNIELINSIFVNSYDNGKDACCGIICRLVNKGRWVLLDDITIQINTDYGNTYSIKSDGYGVVQAISILGGNVTATHTVEPVNVINAVAGTSIIVRNQPLTNPYS